MSDYFGTMAQIVKTIHPLLKEAGFRKLRHTFNRETEPGLTQVVNFQMGSYPVGSHQELPPFRLNLYGKFTINLGVFISEVHERQMGTAPPSFILEYHCTLRKRLPDLLPEDQRPVTDKGVGWWSLDDPSLKTANEIRRLTKDYVLPFFETVKTRDGVIDRWRRDGKRSGLPPAAPLVIAIVEANRGNTDHAERLIRDYVGSGIRNPGHREFVEDMAASMGITLS